MIQAYFRTTVAGLIKQPRLIHKVPIWIDEVGCLHLLSCDLRIYRWHAGGRPKLTYMLRLIMNAAVQPSCTRQG